MRMAACWYDSVSVPWLRRVWVSPQDINLTYLMRFLHWKWGSSHWYIIALIGFSWPIFMYCTPSLLHTCCMISHSQCIIFTLIYFKPIGLRLDFVCPLLLWLLALLFAFGFKTFYFSTAAQRDLNRVLGLQCSWFWLRWFHIGRQGRRCGPTCGQRGGLKALPLASGWVCSTVTWLLLTHFLLLCLVIREQIYILGGTCSRIWGSIEDVSEQLGE